MQGLIYIIILSTNVFKWFENINHLTNIYIYIISRILLISKNTCKENLERLLTYIFFNYTLNFTDLLQDPNILKILTLNMQIP